MNRIPPAPSFFVTVMALISMILAIPQSAEAATDWGDNTSMVLTVKAWDALSAQKYDDALDYVNRCVDTYHTQATQMQAAMTTRPANEPKETTSSRWALNDCATCLFIKGEVLLKKGDKAGAKDAYGRVVKEFKDGLCWDSKGWFWCPADACKSKIVELEFDGK